MSDNLLDFEIDKLTNSIENTLTGEIFETNVSRISMSDKKLIKKSLWLFDWNLELNNSEREVFKLSTVDNSGEKGYEGFVAFDSKTALIKHYEKTLGATHFRGQRMFIETRAAQILVKTYFKNL